MRVPTLSEDERVRVVELVVDEAGGRVPVLAGAGGYNTREVIHVGKRMRQAGATGLLSVTPYYNKPTPEGLYQHYRAIADGVGAADHRLQRARAHRLERRSRHARAARHHPGIAGVKEASGNMSQICDVCRVAPEGFVVLSGDDSLTLPVMSVGGKGSSPSHRTVCRRKCRGWWSWRRRTISPGAQAASQLLMPFLAVNFVEANPIPIKAAMAMMGLLEERYRLPMVPPQPASREKIAAVLQTMGGFPASCRQMTSLEREGRGSSSRRERRAEGQGAVIVEELRARAFGRRDSSRRA